MTLTIVAESTVADAIEAIMERPDFALGLDTHLGDFEVSITRVTVAVSVSPPLATTAFVSAVTVSLADYVPLTDTFIAGVSNEYPDGDVVVEAVENIKVLYSFTG